MADAGKVQKRRKRKKERDLLLKPEGLWAGLQMSANSEWGLRFAI